MTLVVYAKREMRRKLGGVLEEDRATGMFAACGGKN